MLEGIFEINSYEMDDIVGYIKQTSSGLDSANDEAKDTYKVNKESDVFGKGATKINNQAETLYVKIENLGNTMENGTSAVYNLEVKLAEEAKSMQIPKGFEINNTVSNKEISSISLNKNDGVSVNQGVASNEVVYDDSSQISKATVLTDITKAETQAQVFDENQLKVHTAELKNIVTADTKEQSYDENAYTDNKQILTEMKTDSPTEINDYVQYDKTQKTNLQKMDNSGNAAINNQDEMYSDLMNNIPKVNLDKVGE